MLLIDGYNLLHAAGLAPAGYASGRIEAARDAFVKQLSVRLTGQERQKAIVVFDAKLSPLEKIGATPTQMLHGVRLMFAVEQPEADDLLEQLISRNAASGTMLVSGDRRLLIFAKRHRVKATSSEAFWSWLHRRRLPSSQPTTEAGDLPQTPEDVARWMAIFSETDNGSSLSKAPPSAFTPPSRPVEPLLVPKSTPTVVATVRLPVPSPLIDGQENGHGTPPLPSQPADVTPKKAPPPTTPCRLTVRPPLRLGEPHRPARPDAEPPAIPPGKNPFPPGYGDDLLDDQAWLDEE